MFTRATFTFLLSVVVSVTLLAAQPVYGQHNQGGQDLATGKRADSETKNKEPSAAQKFDDLIDETPKNSHVDLEQDYLRIIKEFKAKGKKPTMGDMVDEMGVTPEEVKETVKRLQQKFQQK